MLSPVRVSPPIALPVSLAEAKLHLRVDGSDEDTLIQGYINAAFEALDGYDGTLGRCLALQVWEQEYEEPTGDLVLPLGPISSATIVGFTDFRLLKDARGYFLRLDDNASWPEGPLTVQFEAGYSELPAPIHSAILLHIGSLYEGRETMGDKVNHTRAYEALLAPYRDFRG